MTGRSEVSGVPGTRFSVIEIVAETGSTNADLLEASMIGDFGPGRAGRVLVTNHQTAGRGRQGRVWIDEPESALLTSVLLRPDPAWASLLPLATGLALVRGINSHVSLQPNSSVGLKWPNDVLETTSGRKLAGILAEARSGPNGLVVVVGFGMNLRWTKREEVRADPVLANRAIDLASVATEPPDRVELLRRCLTEFEALLISLESGGSAEVVGAYRDVCDTIGRHVDFETSREVISGVAIGVDDGGGLVIESSDGDKHTVTAGDAHHR